MTYIENAIPIARTTAKKIPKPIRNSEINLKAVLTNIEKSKTSILTI